MDNTQQLPDNNSGKNLGTTLIDWIRMVNRKNLSKNREPENSLKNGQSSGPGYADLLSVKIKINDTMGKWETRSYR
jgi:hypothetical protein